jgi:hypothetical protein
VTRAVRDSDDVLVCRLIKGKITFVHRRLWPALVRAAGRLPSVRLRCVRSTRVRDCAFGGGGTGGVSLDPLACSRPRRIAPRGMRTMISL